MIGYFTAGCTINKGDKVDVELDNDGNLIIVASESDRTCTVCISEDDARRLVLYLISRGIEA